MPNVDQFERDYKVLLKGLADDENSLIDSSLESLHELQTTNKPTLFRKHSTHEIRMSAEELLNHFDSVSSLEYSVNNKDLYDVLVNGEHHLELKLGAATDAAIGLASVKDLTHVDFLEPEISHWREEIQNKTPHDLENTDFLSRRLSAYRNFISHSANSVEKVKVSSYANTVLNNFVLGLNVNSEEIAHLEHVPTIILTTYTKKGWVLKPLSLKDKSDWEIVSVEYNDTTNRVRIIFSNGDISIKILSNQKNSYKSNKLKANGIPKIEPKYGFGSLSFNLWVDRD